MISSKIVTNMRSIDDLIRPLKFGDNIYYFVILITFVKLSPFHA